MRLPPATGCGSHDLSSNNRRQGLSRAADTVTLWSGPALAKAHCLVRRRRKHGPRVHLSRTWRRPLHPLAFGHPRRRPGGPRACCARAGGRIRRSFGSPGLPSRRKHCRGNDRRLDRRGLPCNCLPGSGRLVCLDLSYIWNTQSCFEARNFQHHHLTQRKHVGSDPVHENTVGNATNDDGWHHDHLHGIGSKSADISETTSSPASAHWARLLLPTPRQAGRG